MGLIDPPLLYLDTCVFVAAFEESGPNAGPTRRLFDALISKPGFAITSELTLAELLAPSMNIVMSVAERRHLYLKLFDDVGFVSLKPVTREVLMDTVALRENHPQRVPDAIHIATAIATGCRYFMSFDNDARRLPPALTWLTPTDREIDELLKILDA